MNEKYSVDAPFSVFSNPVVFRNGKPITINEVVQMINTYEAELQYFVDRVENGTIFSKVTYARFKKALEKHN